MMSFHPDRHRGRELTVSNLDKVLFPDTGFTKGQLIDYYVRIAAGDTPAPSEPTADDEEVPRRRRRQVLLREAQPVARAGLGPALVVPSTDGHDDIPYVMVNDLPTLAWAANLGTIELHVPLWHAGDSRKLPAQSRPDGLRPRSRPGHLHRRVLRRRRATWPTSWQSRAWSPSPRPADRRVCSSTPRRAEDDMGHARETAAHEIARKLEAEHREPRRLEHAPLVRRENRVLIDWSQNHPAKTTVAVYSVRAMPRNRVHAGHSDEVRRCAKRTIPRFSVSRPTRSCAGWTRTATSSHLSDWTDPNRGAVSVDRCLRRRNPHKRGKGCGGQRSDAPIRLQKRVNATIKDRGSAKSRRIRLAEAQTHPPIESIHARTYGIEETVHR